MKKNVILALIATLIFAATRASAQDNAANNAGAVASPELTTITNVAKSVASETVSNLLTNAAPVWSKYFHAEAGVVLLDSFSLSPSAESPGNFDLKSGSTDARGMIQIDFQDRYAWRHSYYEWGATNEDTNETWGFAILDHWWPNRFSYGQGSNDIPILPLDAELQLGYAFGSSGSQSTSTAGSGDFYGSASLGLDLITYWHPHKGDNIPFVWTLGPEGFGNFASDSQYSLIHTAYGIGIAYTAGIPWQDNTKLQLKVRVGYGRADAPVPTGANTGAPDYNPIIVGVDGAPEFSMKDMVDFQGELRVPIPLSNKQFGYLAIGGEAYQFPGNERDQWSTYIAATFDLSSLTKLALSTFTSLSGLQPQE